MEVLCMLYINIAYLIEIASADFGIFAPQGSRRCVLEPTFHGYLGTTIIHSSPKFLFSCPL
jgi:hypothetical protein